MIITRVAMFEIIKCPSPLHRRWMLMMQLTRRRIADCWLRTL
jgi:hypothetical protein